MAGRQVLSRPLAAEGGGRRPAVTGLATQPYSATEVDGWQHKLSRVSQNRAAVHRENCRHQQEGRRIVPAIITVEVVAKHMDLNLAMDGPVVCCGRLALKCKLSCRPYI